MTRVTIDLDRLRATMPKHPTWPTGYDTTDNTERDECWQAMSRWLETGLCDPESDNDRQHGATAPREPETGTQQLSWLDVLDYLDGEIDTHRYLPGPITVPANVFDAYKAGCSPMFEDKTLGRPNHLYKGVRIFRADDGPPWPPPTPAMHESELAGPAGPDCITTDCRDCPTDCEYTVARLWAWEQLTK